MFSADVKQMLSEMRSGFRENSMIISEKARISLILAFWEIRS